MMKRFSNPIARVLAPALALLLLIPLTLATLTPPVAADANDFTFESFTADYYLSRDTDHISQLKVDEALIALFPDTDQNHGIERAIPQTYQGHPTHLKITAVTDDTGQPLHYTTSTSNDNLVLRIGDADRYVHGRQIYRISYTQDNVTVNPAGHDGFFWDTNGDQWGQTFTAVTARIHLSTDLLAAHTASTDRCFTGANGSTAKDCRIAITQPSAATPTTTSGSIITASTTRPLNANETLTTELDFTSGTFAAYHMPTAELPKILAIALLGTLLPIVFTLIFTISRWRRFGRDPEGRGTLIPQYLPPKDLSVLGAGIIVTEGFRPSYISATIIDLAVRHYLKIYEVETSILFTKSTDYELELIKHDDQLDPDSQAVIDLLFGTTTPGARIKLSDLSQKLYQPAAKVGEAATERTTAAGYFRTDPNKAKLPFMITGIILLFGGFLLIMIAPGISIAGLIFLIMSFLMPARTQQGVQMREYLLGLKMYMKLAEADRLATLQSTNGRLTEKINVNDQTKLVKLYERLLPYAMLFGIEKSWAAEFAKLYQESPDWYIGHSTFQAASFAGAMSTFSTTTTTSFSPPSSSGSGGSAGGGGGGGGGGGW